MPYLTDIQSLLAWKTILLPPENGAPPPDGSGSESAAAGASAALDNNVPVVAFPQRAERYYGARRDGERRRRQLLVCHDMMGGYSAEDRDPQGNAELAQVFTLHAAMAAADTFVYFAHHRVAIPPAQWTNLAHACGCRALGMLIFEHAPGVRDLALFMYGGAAEDIEWPPPRKPDKGRAPGNDKEGAGGEGEGENAEEPIDIKLPPLSYEASERIVEIVKYYKLDGWFFNVEVPLPGREAQARDLVRLVQYLDRRLKEVNPQLQVIWYDSVTDAGQLRWQNVLNARNKDFFAACSGIFVNYFWKEDFPQRSAEAAGAARARDVYTGIDVWGRNTWGGGGLRSGAAMRVIARAGTSAAVFAPAWAYEANPRDAFLATERALWDPILRHVDAPTRPLMPTDDACDQFNTYFNTACGTQFVIHGKDVIDAKWSNHSLQSQIPVLSPQATLDPTAAFFGAGCVRLDRGELVLPLADIELHSDTVVWLVYRPATPGEGVALHAEARAADAAAGGAETTATTEIGAKHEQLVPGTQWYLAGIQRPTAPAPATPGEPRLALNRILLRTAGAAQIGQIAVHRLSRRNAAPQRAPHRTRVLSSGAVAVDRADADGPAQGLAGAPGGSDALRRTTPCAICVAGRPVAVMLQPRYVLPPGTPIADITLRYLWFWEHDPRGKPGGEDGGFDGQPTQSHPYVPA